MAWQCPFNLLVPQGADVNALDGDGLPMLSLAAASGHLECIEVVVENSADVNAQTKRWGDISNSLTVLVGSLFSNGFLFLVVTNSSWGGGFTSLLLYQSSHCPTIVPGILHRTSVFAKGLQESTA